MCNDREKFISSSLQHGLYIPHKDPDWEEDEQFYNYRWLTASVVYPDPKESEYFGRIRIRKKSRYCNKIIIQKNQRLNTCKRTKCMFFQ
jgi:hypothetical protein